MAMAVLGVYACVAEDVTVLPSEGCAVCTRLCTRVCTVWWCPCVLQASLQVSAMELQRASYDDLARAHAEVLRRISELGGSEVWCCWSRWHWMCESMSVATLRCVCHCTRGCE